MNRAFTYIFVVISVFTTVSLVIAFTDGNQLERVVVASFSGGVLTGVIAFMEFKK